MNVKLLPIKIYVVGGDVRYVSWFTFSHEVVPETLEGLKEADLIMFTGGSDVTPSLYGEKLHPTTRSDYQRDLKEMEIYQTALKLKIPMIGICRGSQFLTVMQEGGSLVQNVSRHAEGNHSITILGTNETYSITSTHHQMMYPFKVANCEIIAGCPKGLSSKYEFGDYTVVYLPGDLEPEIVYYKTTNCLCIQGHPEMMHQNMPVLRYLNNLVLDRLKLEPYEEIK